MSKIDDGGAAFPDPCGAHSGAFPPDCAKGMSLRDYFAAAALQSSIIASVDDKYEWQNVLGDSRFLDEHSRLPSNTKDCWKMIESPAQRIAAKCYEMADAMLAARKEGA